MNNTTNSNLPVVPVVTVVTVGVVKEVDVPVVAVIDDSVGPVVVVTVLGDSVVNVVGVAVLSKRKVTYKQLCEHGVTALHTFIKF